MRHGRDAHATRRRFRQPALRGRALFAFLAAFGLCAAARAAGGDPFAPAVGERDVDLAACRTVRNGQASPASEAEVLGALGLRGGKAWTAGQAEPKRRTSEFGYLVAFRRPVAIGSLLVPKEIGAVRAMKAPAPYPPDPARPAHWRELTIPPRQSGGRLVTVPPGLRTRAILLIDRRQRGRSRLDRLRLLRPRLRNVTPAALAYAESEHTVRPSMSSPYTLAAACVTTGRGCWQNTGPDRNGKVAAAPISDVQPTWFLLCWDAPQAIRGLWLTGSIRQFALDAYTGPAEINPHAATEREWKPLTDVQARREGEAHWASFGPVRTRGLRVRILGTDPPQIARIDGLHVFVDAGEAPPAPAGPDEPEAPAPLTIPYDLPADGTLTMAIDDATGRRVRHLVTRRPRTKGPHAEGWDLRGDDGASVPPGEYRWKGLFHPPLKLAYQMCPYPNVTGRSPWLTGHAGPGGWLADHTPPACVCAAGQRVYLGAPCAESGVSFIECDLAGRKLWGKHSFAAWTGPWRMATDGRSVFVTNGKHQVWSVDIATKRVGKAVELPPTADRKGRIRGIAARDGKVYLSFAAGAWLTGAAEAGDVDIEHCLPKYPKPGRSTGSSPPADPRTDFLRLLRLTGTPAGMPDSRGSLTYLETSRGPELRQHLLVCFRRAVPVGSVVLPVPAEKDVSVRLSVLKANAPYPPDAKDARQWAAFETHGRKGAWDVALPPKDTRTRALRVTFTRGKEDIFTDLGGLEGLVAPRPTAGGRRPRGRAWQGRLEGLKVLRRRYVNVAPAARVRVSSGKVLPDGTWDARRRRPVHEGDPGIYVMQWARPQRLRGLALREIDGKRTKIDVFVGPDDAEVPLAGDAGWEELATYDQPLRDYYQGTANRNEQARYLDGYVSFGREVRTRAIRLRVVEQWLVRPARPTGVRRDLGGQQLDSTRCRVFGVAALTYVGGEPPVDPKVHERVVEYDPAAKAVLREVHVGDPGELAFDPRGRLHAFSGGRVVRVDFAGAPEPLPLDVARPVSMTFDAAGSLYVFDGADDRKNVRVYSPDGKLARTIGRPGGY